MNADILATLASFQALITPPITLKPTYTSPVEDEKKPLPLQRNGISQSTLEFWRAETKKMTMEKHENEKKMERPAVRRTYAVKRKFPDTEKEMQKLLLHLRGSTPMEYDPQEGSSTSSSTQSPQPLQKTVAVQATPVPAIQVVQAVQVKAPELTPYEKTLKSLMKHPSLKAALLEPTIPANLEILKNAEMNAKCHDEKLRKIQELPPKYSKFDQICLAYLYATYHSLTAENVENFAPFDFGPLCGWVKKMIDLHHEFVAIGEKMIKVAKEPVKLAKLEEKLQARIAHYKAILGSPFANQIQNVQWVLMHKTAVKMGRLEVDNTTKTVMAVKSAKGEIHALSFPKPSQVVGTCDTEQLNQLMEYYKHNMLGEIPTSSAQTEIAENQLANGVESESSGLSSAAPAAVAATVAEMKGIWMNGEGGFPIPATSSTASSSSSSATTSGLNLNLTALLNPDLLKNLSVVLALANQQANITTPASLPTSSDAPLLHAALLNANTTVSAQLAASFTSPPVQSSSFLGVNGAAPIQDQESAPSTSSFLSPTLASNAAAATFQPQIIPVPASLSPYIYAPTPTSINSPVFSSTLALSECLSSSVPDTYNAASPISPNPAISAPVIISSCCSRRSSMATTKPIELSDASSQVPLDFAPIIVCQSDSPAPHALSQETEDAYSKHLEPEDQGSVILEIEDEASPATDISTVQPVQQLTSDITSTEAEEPLATSSIAEFIEDHFEGNSTAPIAEPTEDDIETSTSHLSPVHSSEDNSVHDTPATETEQPLATASIADSIEDQIESSASQLSFVACSEEIPRPSSNIATKVFVELSDTSSPAVLDVALQEPACSNYFEPGSQNSDVQETETESSSIQASESTCHASPVEAESVPRPTSPIADPIEDNCEDSTRQLDPVTSPDSLASASSSATSMDTDSIPSNSGLQASSSVYDGEETETENEDEETEENDPQPSCSSTLQQPKELKIETLLSEGAGHSLECSTPSCSNSPIVAQIAPGTSEFLTPPSTTSMLPESPGPVFKYPSVEDTEERQKSESAKEVQKLMAQLQEETARKEHLEWRIDVLQKDLLPLILEWNEKIKLCSSITNLIKLGNLSKPEIKEYERKREQERDNYKDLSPEIEERQHVLLPLREEKSVVDLNLKDIREQLKKHGINIPDPDEEKEEEEKEENQEDGEGMDSSQENGSHSSLGMDSTSSQALPQEAPKEQFVSDSVEGTSTEKNSSSRISNAEKLESPSNETESTGQENPLVYSEPHCTERLNNAEDLKNTPRKSTEEYKQDAEEAASPSRDQEEKTPSSSAGSQGGKMKIKISMEVWREANEKTKMLMEMEQKEKRKEEKEAKKLSKRRRTEADRRESKSSQDDKLQKYTKRVRKSIS
ncbi:hypothetical protein CAEBREN_18759 [Caenorhabditis brenneri]|uniref:Uncharacterized protein n=1 Tax=Caenorhabditis brenneri TaxID=135651 RepID=G0MCP0_CAEBE|nr:hypothetical protein CAEBREN_18759 [Caenorhabditis brenneri]